MPTRLRSVTITVKWALFDRSVDLSATRIAGACEITKNTIRVHDESVYLVYTVFSADIKKTGLYMHI